jgi:hypothetical protein
LAAGAVPARQPDQPPDQPPGPLAGPTPAVGEVGPEIFYLEDDAGRLVPVPGFSYRDFVDLFRLQQGLPAAVQPPAVVLENLLVRIDLDPDPDPSATRGATVECKVRQTRAGWVHLPLQLDGLLLTEPPRHEGPGRMIVDADRAHRGYRAWFDARPEAGAEARHEIVLRGRVPVDTSTTHDSVGLRLPAATTSVVELRTSRQAAEATVSPAAPEQRIATRLDAARTVVTVAGLAGAVRIRVAEAGAADGGWEAVPAAFVESAVRVDGRTAFFEAAVRLENLAPDTARVLVSLPPRATLRSVRPPAAIVDRGGTDEQPTAVVSIDRDATGRALVELECERPIDPTGGQDFDAIGFAVGQVEPWRQSGRVSLEVGGELQAVWSDGSGVRRTDPPAAGRRPAFVAAFAYDAQPASLPVRVRPRRSRVVIEPEHRYEVAATRIGMQSRLRINASGAPAESIAIALDDGWNLDDVGPAGIVDTGGVTIGSGTVTIPFLQPLAGEAVVEVRASRRIDREAEKLSWRLPLPRADLVAPAVVSITSASDIELMPDAAASTGLVRQTGGGLPRTEGGGITLAYRVDSPPGVFAAARRFLPQTVESAVDVRLVVDEAEVAVTESIRLEVAHVPLEYLELRVPEAVAASESLEVRQDGILLYPFDVASAQREEDVGTGSSRLMRAILAAPLLGRGGLEIAYRLPTPALPPETTVAEDLPLVLPEGGRIERQSVRVDPADMLAVDLRGDAWRRSGEAIDGPLEWVAARRQDAVPLAIAARPRVAANEVVVEAAWLRTHLLPEGREDIATYALAGRFEPTSIVVPIAGGDPLASCEARLDGVALPTTNHPDGGFAVELPRAAAGRRLLEIRTAAAGAAGWIARLGLPAPVRLEPPIFSSGVTQRRFYWEITARPDEHLVGAPIRWTSQQRWRAGLTGLEQSPIVSSDVLAAWVRDAAGGAAPAAVDPPLVERRAVYSGLGPPGPATIWIVPTWFAVLAASGTTLAAGLALAYLPGARRPAVIVPALAVLSLAAAAFPALAPLAAQAAAPGAALAALACGLRAYFDGDVGRGGRSPAATVSASSLTRAVLPQPSLIVAGSSLRRREESAVSTGRRGP